MPGVCRRKAFLSGRTDCVRNSSGNSEKIFAPLAVLVVKREKTADDIGNDTVSVKKDSENSVTESYWRERAKAHGPDFWMTGLSGERFQ